MLSEFIYLAIGTVILTKIMLWIKSGRNLKASEIAIIKRNLIRMDHRTFELFCGELFSEMGYKSTVTKATRDGGKDVILTDKRGKRYYVECKHYKGSVGRPIADRLWGISAADHIYRAKLISTGHFTEDCLRFCKRTGIECIDTNKIMSFVKRYGTAKLLKYK